MDAFREYFIDIFTKKYLKYEGRARRREYWLFFLFCLLFCTSLGVVLGVLTGIIDGLNRSGGSSVIILIAIGIFYLASLIPSLMLGIRRLHDIGQSGWLMLISLIPYLGAIVLLVMFCLDSQKGSNKYGPNPKGE